MKNKWLVSIPLVIIVYLLHVNFMPFGAMESYSIDIGGPDDLQGMARLTGPMDRVSEPNETEGITFRNLTQGLVYFDLKSPYLKEKGEVAVKVKFRDNFPEGQKFMLGAKNNASYSYAWKDVYVPFYEALRRYPSVKIDDTQVYLINGDVLSGFDEVPDGSVIAANTKIDLNPYAESLEGTALKNLSITVTLRESHVFYTYVDDGVLNLTIGKQDLNWYSGADELKIEVYSFKDELIGRNIIPDDGDLNKSNVLGNVQRASLLFSNLKKGVYRINLIAGADLLIQEIELDKGILVSEGRLFLVGDNSAYFKGRAASPVEVYFKNPRNSTMVFQTYHSTGFQNITVNSAIVKGVDINKTGTGFSLFLDSNDEINTLISEKGNVMIDSMDYFSFTQDSYFTPKRFKIVELKPDPAWIRDNVDYVFLRYNFPEGAEWKVGDASWDIDELYIKDNTLSFSFNVPHLGKEEFRYYMIPIDSIELEVKIPPIWKR